MLQKKIISLLPVLFVIVICLPILFPFFHSGYFPTHDGEWAVVRLGDMFRLLRDYQFPARFSGNLNFGYGYPLFNFAYPFPYYLGVLLHFFHIGFITSIKIIFASTVFISAIGMYFASSMVWKSKIAGILSSVLYVYLPYRLVDLYVRGSIGESVALALFPWILFFLFRLLQKPRLGINSAFIAVLYSLLIMAHNIMAVEFSIFLGVLVLYLLVTRQYKILKQVIYSLLLGILLSGFFMIPALFEKSLITLSKIPIADRSLYFVSLSQLIFPSWGYGTPTESSPFTYQIGWPHLVLFLTAGGLFLSQWKKTHTSLQKEFFIILLITFVIMVVLLFSFTENIWRYTLLLHEINYPWTLLAPLGLVISFSVGFITQKKNIFKYFGIFLAIAAIIQFAQYAKPSKYIYPTDQYYLTNEATTTSSDELMPLWVKQKAVSRFRTKVEVIQGSSSITDLVYNSKLASFTTNTSAPTTIAVNTIYYPGWQIKVDSNQVPISYNNSRGIMMINLSPGMHVVRATFTETLLRLFADFISVVGLILVIYLFIKDTFYFKK